MELIFIDSANLVGFSSSFSKFNFNVIVPLNPSKTSKFPSHFVVRMGKKNSNNNNIETSKGFHQKEYSKGNLCRILRTEAAVKGIEKKANSQKFTNLSPKAVLEALDDSIANNQWESSLKKFELLRRQQWYEPRTQTYAKLLTMLGKCRQPRVASLLFERMLSEGLKPTIYVYTSLVGAYGLGGLFDEAFQTIDEMKSVSNCKPNIYTYSIVINCCMKLRRFDLIDGILGEMSYLGIGCSTVTYNTIIDGYGKAEMFELMENTLTDMVESGRCLPDVFTLNSVVWAYGNVERIEEMERWYNEFQHMGVSPDIKTFNILIKSYGKAGMHEKMASVMEFTEKRFFSPTIVTYNVVIDIFGKAKNIEKMEYFFLTMKYKGVKPNSITYSSLVSAYSKAGLITKKIGTVIKQIENSDVVLDTPFFNCVISAFGQARELSKMEEMYLKMIENKCTPDHITFSTMIQAYHSLGMVEAAQELEMKALETKNSLVSLSRTRAQTRV